MITKNSNGATLSAGFISALTDVNRTYDAKILCDGVEINGAIASITVTKGSCGSEDGFTIGSVVGSTLVAEIKNLTDAVKGKELEVQIGLLVESAYEYVTLGFFTVSEVQQTAYASTVTAYGATITKTSGAFIVPQTASLTQIASSISQSVSELAGRDVSVTFDSGIDTSNMFSEALNNLTVYQMLQILASVCGGYAVDTYDGNIKICRFSDTPTLERTITTIREPLVEEVDFQITGVLCIVSEEAEDEEGEIIPAVTIPAYPTGDENLYVQNEYMTQDFYNANYVPLTEYQYRPASIGMTLGDPRLEGDDVLSITDVNSEVYIVPCHMITHTYAGGFSTQVIAVNATPQENEVASSAGNLTERLSDINSNAISARASAESAKQSAQIAQQSAETAQASANQAIQDAQTAQQSAKSAQQSADDAQNSAVSANASANSALNQLSEVEKVLDVLNWASEHGEYALTEDITVEAGKYYFEPIAPTSEEAYSALLDESDVELANEDSEIIFAFEAYMYAVVFPSGDENPQEMGWYELAGIDEALSNYVSSHLALTESGLWLQTDGVDSKVLLSASDGLVLYGSLGQPLAKYGESAIIGDETGFHIEISDQEIGFYQVQQKIAYINGNRLYITQSVVLDQMDIGEKVAYGGKGQWSWCVHPIDNRNNLYLKWLG